MIRRHLRILIIALLCLSVTLLSAAPHTAAADTTAAPKNKGLYISPVRQYVSLDAGTVKTSKITVGNYTSDQMVVRFSVKAFSVKDLSYNFVFTDPPYKSIDFATSSITLKPNETRAVPYTITLPPNSKPGGQYYTLFATGTGATGNARQQVQAASLLYLTVNGKLIKSGSLTDSSVSHFTFHPEIPFSLTIKNTGNIHYFIYISAEAAGFSGKKQMSSETHLLMPATTRKFASSVQTPQWPGIYHVSYGYTTDFQQTVNHSSYALYIPPWFIALLIVSAWFVWIIIHRRRRQKPQPSDGVDPRD